MYNPNPFSGKNWFKGNLHAHTTRSDGVLSPEQVKDIYRSGGYDFLSFTDHDIYDASPGLSEEGFLMIPGGEFGANAAEEDRTALRPEKTFHFILNACDPGHRDRLPPSYRFSDERTPGTFDARIRGICETARASGNLVTLAHPAGSGHFEHTPALNPYFDAVEIYNNAAEVGEGTGSGEHMWDYLLRNGHRVWGIASDDAHFRRQDGCGGWIMVSADNLDTVSVMNAVKSGSFYSTTGPQIFEYREQEGRIKIRCSPCYKIRFIQYDHRGRACYSEDGVDSMTEAEFEYDKEAKYIRAECIRRDGKKAWTNPIFIEYPYPADDSAITEKTDPAKEKGDPVPGILIKTESARHMRQRHPLRNGTLRCKGNLHTHTTNSDGVLRDRKSVV